MVKIRWFGLLIGYLFVNLADRSFSDHLWLNALLGLGILFTSIDTLHSYRGRILLGRFPLTVSLMEAFFIGLLCFHHRGIDSFFRYFYFLSLICCAIRHSTWVTWITCLLHSMSFTLLYFTWPASERSASTLLLIVVIMIWVTWASDALAFLLKRVGNYLEELNQALRENQGHLEERIEQRTQELHEAQAHVLHQEKMAALGLLAAGVAHEVGNPLTSISSLVQMLQKREHDEKVTEKLSLINGQLLRIQGTLRELVQFSRPASSLRSRVALHDVVEEALSIAKYYKRTGKLQMTADVPADLPRLMGVRDQLMQVFLNLILNAIDAIHVTALPRIKIKAEQRDGWIDVSICDNGCGLTSEQEQLLFRPYFTTKKHGTGLGLFVTRKLVEGHGGTIGHESNPEGGACFQVRLPHTPVSSV